MPISALAASAKRLQEICDQAPNPDPDADRQYILSADLKEELRQRWQTEQESTEKDPDEFSQRERLALCMLASSIYSAT